MNYLARYCFFIFISLMVTGCSINQQSIKPPLEPPETFSSKGVAPLPDKWWQSFNDEQLDQLVQSALKKNFSIKVAWSRLQQAYALVKKKRAGLWPTLSWSAEHAHQISDSEEKVRADTLSYALGLKAGYEVDLWGRIRSAREAQLVNARAAIEDLNTAALTLAAEIAVSWYQIIAYRGQLELMHAQIETNAKYLEVITARFRRGQVSAADVLQQKQTIEAIRDEIHKLAWQLKTAEHKLCIYLASPPGSLELPGIAALPSLPELPQTGIPAAIIGRRPDVRAAWLNVVSKNLSVAEALSNRYPRLTLSAGASLTSNRTTDFLKNWLINLTAGLMGPIFDGHLRKAEVERVQAVLQEKIDQYGQIVLAAVKEVEDALVREAQQNKYIASLQKQYGLAGQSAELILEQYLQGAEEYTRYLNAQLSYQRLARTLLTAKLELLINRISLYRALAGGFELAGLELEDL